ncbi:hypothetical protein LZC95_11780 [Pendulispora brunnea]|uniref:Insecticide toxin TcdB middle/N-terminal domain-containing protein n=1 Tax=Pendulispora brunnea TaxID=2905690 RepID=A0ABZ2KIU5_9BACT
MSLQKLRGESLVALITCAAFIANLLSPGLALASEAAAEKALPVTPPRSQVTSEKQGATSTELADAEPPAGATTIDESPGSLASVNPSTGAGHATYPFHVPSPRGNLSLALALTYSTALGDSDAGLGWSLGLPAIERRSPGGTAHPRYNDPPIGTPINADSSDINAEDQFVYGGAPLVAMCFIGEGGSCVGEPNAPIPDFAKGGGWHLYRLVTDRGGDLRFFWSPDHNTWVMLDRSGQTSEFGIPRDNRIQLGNTIDLELLQSPKTSAPFRWKLSRRFDNHLDATGNAQNLIYFAWDGDGALSDVYHTPAPRFEQPWQNAFAHHVRFSYASYEFPRSAGPQHVAWRNTPNKRLSRVDVTSTESTGNRELLHRYHLSYRNTAHHSYLETIQQEGRCSSPIAEDASGALPDATNCPRLPARRMVYSTPSPRFDSPLVRMGTIEFPNGDSKAVNILDLNSDGLPDILKKEKPNNDQTIYLNSIEGPENTLSRRTIKLDEKGWASVDGSRLSEEVYFGDFRSVGSVTKLVATTWEKPDTSSPTKWPHNTLLALEPHFDRNTNQWLWSFLGQIGAFDYPTGPSDPEIHSFFIRQDIDMDGYVDRLVETGRFESSGLYYPTGHATELTAVTPGRNVRPFGEDFQEHNVYRANTTCDNDSISRAVQDSIRRAQLGFPDWSPPVRIADMDGDQLGDLVIFTPGNDTSNSHVEYWPGRGDGWFGVNACQGNASTGLVCNCEAPSKVMPPGPPFLLPQREPMFVHDVTGDGLADVLRPYSDRIQVHVNIDGEAWEVHDLFSVAGLPGWDPNKAQITFADMNGSGVDDIVVIIPEDGNKKNSVAYVDLYGRNKPGLLVGITDERGGEVTFGYMTIAEQAISAQQLGKPWQSQTPQPAQLVSSILVSNGLSGARRIQTRVSYDYADPAYDAWARKPRGFRHVRETRHGDGVLPTRITDTSYAIDFCGTNPCERSTAVGPYADAIQGLPVLSETFSTGPKGESSPTYISTSHRKYLLRQLNDGMYFEKSYRLSQEESDTWLYDQTGGEPQTVNMVDVRMLVQTNPPRWWPDPSTTVNVRSTTGSAHLRTTRYLDDNGNEIERIAWGRVEGGDRPITTKTTWKDIGGSNYPRLFRPETQSLAYANGDPKQTRTFSFAFNAAGDRTDLWGDLDGTLPLLRRHENAAKHIAPAPADASTIGPHRILLEHRDIDTFGNVRHVQAPGHRCKDVQFDDAFQALPVVTTTYVGIATDNSCGNQALTTIEKYDRGLAKPLVTWHPDGAASRFTYDTFGRPHEMFQPDPNAAGMWSTIPSNIIDHFDDSIGHRVRSRNQRGNSEIYQEIWQYSDSFGNALATLEGADPAAGDSAKWILSGLSDRSPAGAPVRSYQVEFYNGEASTFDINFHSDKPSDRLEYDMLGRVHVRYGIDGAPAAQYDYHPLSTIIWDAQDLNPTTPDLAAPLTVYRDGHGRTVSIVEYVRRASGLAETITTGAEYLATGETTKVSRISSTGSKYQRSMSYDTLGRLVQNIEPNTTEWRYAYNDAGELVGSSDARGCGKNIAYDSGGRVLAEDFSPCLDSQADYTPPDLLSGDGTESLYVYDKPDSETQATFVLGHLTATYDRGAHTRIRYDGRSRITNMSRAVAKPGISGAELTGRYSQHWFQKDFEYSSDNAILRASTGADVEGLFGSDGTSNVSATYSLRGLPTSVTSSYGPLITKSKYDFDNQPLQVTYGDKASTIAAFHHDVHRRVDDVTISRNAPDIWKTPPVDTVLLLVLKLVNLCSSTMCSATTASAIKQTSMIFATQMNGPQGQSRSIVQWCTIRCSASYRSITILTMTYFRHRSLARQGKVDEWTTLSRTQRQRSE